MKNEEKSEGQKLMDEMNHFLKKVSLMDSTLFYTAMIKHHKAAETVVQTILENDSLEVNRVSAAIRPHGDAQAYFCLLIWAEDEDGKETVIEIHMNPDIPNGERIQELSVALTTFVRINTPEGEERPDSCLVIITDQDIFLNEIPLRHVLFVNRHTGEVVDDESSVILADGMAQDDSPVGKLMQDLRCCDPDDIQNPELKNCLKKIKETEEGQNELWNFLIWQQQKISG